MTWLDLQSGPSVGCLPCGDTRAGLVEQFLPPSSWVVPDLQLGVSSLWEVPGLGWGLPFRHGFRSLLALCAGTGEGDGGFIGEEMMDNLSAKLAALGVNSLDKYGLNIPEAWNDNDSGETAATAAW